jgi:hypothetical protein
MKQIQLAIIIVGFATLLKPVLACAEPRAEEVPAEYICDELLPSAVIINAFGEQEEFVRGLIQYDRGQSRKCEMGAYGTYIIAHFPTGVVRAVRIK